MENRVYLSVLAPAASSGSVNLVLQTFDAATNFTLAFSATGITTSDTEKQIANRIFDQTRTILSQYGYDWQGLPLAVTYTPEADFMVTRTDHCLCFFSQCQFDLSIASDTTGAVYSVRGNPALSTLANMRKYGPAMNQDYSGMSNASLTALLELLSDEVISETRNPFVASMYVFDIWTDLIDGVRLPKYPVIDMDNPRVDPPFVSFILSISQLSVTDVTFSYHISPDGWVMYKNSQDLVIDWNDPFSMGNQWRVTWVAGYGRIPDAVIMAMVKLSPAFTSFSGYKSLAGGTFDTTFLDWGAERKKIFSTLGYKL